MSTSFLPHWAQVVIGMTIVAIAAILAANSKGELALPATVVGGLTITLTLLGMFNDSVKTVSLNRRAAMQRRQDMRGFISARLALVLCAVGFLVLGIGASCQTTVKDLTIGLDAAICILNTISADEAAGKPEGDAIAHAAVVCGVSTAQAAGVLAAHRKALVLEGYTPKAAK